MFSRHSLVCWSYVCRVCHRWHNIANDPSLWKHIKLTAHHMTIQQLQRFAKTHFTDRLQTLELKFPTAGIQDNTSVL